MLWLWLLAVGASAPLFLLAYAVHRWEKRNEQKTREAYEYAMSDQGIKDAAKRYARFQREVQEELSRQEEKERD